MSFTGGRLSTALLSLLAFCFLSAQAQVSANLSGRVMDPSGAAVPSASVTATDTDSGISRSTLTNQAGQYELFELPVGHYELHAKKDGFAEKVRTGIFLVVGQDATADLTLQVGQIKQ
ncbi:MAG: carboxypeptidase-like regulatory domain-containing protein [Silvibacterium sp.]